MNLNNRGYQWRKYKLTETFPHSVHFPVVCQARHEYAHVNFASHMFTKVGHGQTGEEKLTLQVLYFEQIIFVLNIYNFILCVTTQIINLSYNFFWRMNCSLLSSS
jgi:hypothetical protein